MKMLSRRLQSFPWFHRLRNTAPEVFRTETTVLKQKASRIFTRNRIFDNLIPENLLKLDLVLAWQQQISLQSE